MPEVKRQRSGQTGDEAELRSRLEECEETQRAIRQSLVDAFVVTRNGNDEVRILDRSDYPYRMMVESMNEGAVTLVADGSIFYCNPRMAEMVGTTAEKLLNSQFEDLIIPVQRSVFRTLFAHGTQDGTRMEFCLKANGDECRAVQFSIYQLSKDQPVGVCIIATDLSEHIESEQKIRELASELTMAEQEERHRISQILHDDLQQRLFAINAQLSALEEQLGKQGAPGTAGTEFSNIHKQLIEAIGLTRDLSIDLSPAVLHGEGLGEALEWLVGQMADHYGLNAELHVDKPFPMLSNAMRVMVYQAARELLFNVVKHSGASNAVVHLGQASSQAQMTIQDDGRGFDVAAVLRNRHMTHGLAVIQNRLHLMGGSMELRCPPTGGTQAIIRIPIETEAGIQ